MSDNDQTPSAAEQAVLAHLDRVREEAAAAQARRREAQASAAVDQAASNNTG
jgi:hypothetical protein